MRNRVLSLGLLLGLLVVVSAGCGGKTSTPAKVRGVVKYNGVPLSGGNVIFHSVDKGSYNAPIAQDGSGSYEAVDLPLGELDVTVDTEFLNPNPKGNSPVPPGGGGKAAKVDAEYAAAMAKMKGSAAPVSKEVLAGRYTKIPAKYAKKGQSRLSVTLGNGWTDFDINLTD